MEITSRDTEYVKTVLCLGGFDDPIGPSRLAEEMDISRVAALKKMRRLEELGLGEYVDSKGLLISDKGLDFVKEEARKHHLVERFLQKSLDLEHDVACGEASKIASNFSDDLLRVLADSFVFDKPCDCGFEASGETDVKDLLNCPWISRRNNEKEGGE